MKLSIFFAILPFLIGCGNDSKKPKGDSTLNPSTKEASLTLQTKQFALKGMTGAKDVRIFHSFSF